MSFRPGSWSIKIILSSLHGLLLLVFAILLLMFEVFNEDEKLLIRNSSLLQFSSNALKQWVTGDSLPVKEKIIFINLAREKELIPHPEGGVEVITDRKRLARFFSILNKFPNDYKFAICDVFYQGDSPYDSLLNATLAKTQRIISPCHFENDSLVRPHIQVPTGYADYNDSEGSRLYGMFFREGLFLKFSLMRDGYKSLPLMLHEMVNKAKYEEKNGLLWVNNKLCLSTLNVNLRIKTANMQLDGEDTASYKYPTVALSDLLILEDDSLIFNEFLKDHILVLGDFNSDVHETIFGQMPGTLILLNIYFSLVEGDHLVHWSWLVYLWVAFTLLSYLMFYVGRGQVSRPKWFARFIQSRRGKILTDWFGAAVFLALVSVISYMAFNIHLNVLVLALYINLVVFLLRKYKKIKQAKGLGQGLETLLAEE